ncbi:hypothetical protein ACQR1W_35380 [Bradyrhizobium sp. HKCCYLS1011]|uniref:hypothetical protein n=1 Tax=Bradyrhizobium sp. HKCCYLS1011 TaxID=3420733 RepID=UPI003EBF0B15
MSLLGLDAVGRFAVGQLPVSRAAVLSALPGSYAIGAVASSMRIAQSATAISFGLSGNAVGVAIGFLSSGRPSNVSAASAAFSIPLLAITGGYIADYKTAAAAVGYAVGSANYVLSPLVSTSAVSINASSANWTVTGRQVAFERGHEAWFPLPSDGAVWAGGFIPESGWTSAAAPGEGWSANADSNGTWSKMPDPAGSWTKS